MSCILSIKYLYDIFYRPETVVINYTYDCTKWVVLFVVKKKKLNTLNGTRK